jgi:hypothetical protein
MIRVPSALVGIFVTLALDALVFALARITGMPELAPALLPLCASAGGLLAGRWAGSQPVVPGFSVGLFALAVRIGLALGLGYDLLAFVSPPHALLELIAAIVGGMMGALAARRAAQPKLDARPEYTALS